MYASFFGTTVLVEWSNSQPVLVLSYTCFDMLMYASLFHVSWILFHIRNVYIFFTTVSVEIELTTSAYFNICWVMLALTCWCMLIYFMFLESFSYQIYWFRARNQNRRGNSLVSPFKFPFSVRKMLIFISHILILFIKEIQNFTFELLFSLQNI